MNLLRPNEVSEILGISKRALPALRRRDTSFPKPIRVSQKILRWDEDDINDWLTKKKESIDGKSE